LNSSHCSIRKIFSLEYPDGCKLVIPHTLDFPPSAINAGTILRSPELDIQKTQKESIIQRVVDQSMAPAACRIRTRLSEARQLALCNQVTDAPHDNSSSVSIHHTTEPSTESKELNSLSLRVEKELHNCTIKSLHERSKVEQFNDSESSESEVGGSENKFDQPSSIMMNKVLEETEKTVEHDETMSITSIIDESIDPWKNITAAISTSSVEDIQQGLVKYLWLLNAEMTQFQLEFGSI